MITKSGGFDKVSSKAFCSYICVSYNNISKRATQPDEPEPL